MRSKSRQIRRSDEFLVAAGSNIWIIGTAHGTLRESVEVDQVLDVPHRRCHRRRSDENDTSDEHGALQGRDRDRLRSNRLPA
jgi:hypothetical protein